MLGRLKFELFFFLLGVFYTFQGFIFKFKNKCELKRKPGSVAVITGGARGLGASIVEKLLKCDFHVIIGCRNTSSGAALVRKLRTEKGVTSGSTTILQLDMESNESIHSFSKLVLQTRPKINVLINNAGIMDVPYRETKEGFESQWAINYLGHFLLTHLLLKCMHECGELSRIINVSSCAHMCSKQINFTDVNMMYDYVPKAAYAQSKLAQILFSKYLDQLLQGINSKVQSFAVHPGVVNTDIFDKTIIRKFLNWIAVLFFRTPEEGARSILYATLSEDLNNKGGAYISDCCIVNSNACTYDKKLQKELFQHSMDSLNIKSFGSIL